ncbi:MAG: hypothetical protein ACOCQX_01315 [Candidatus Nanoarchaeia archaeon]
MRKFFILILSMLFAIQIVAGECNFEKSFNECNTTQIASYCDLNNCTQENLANLTAEKKGEVFNKLNSFKNIPFSEITKKENREFINITRDKFIYFYNNLEWEKQSQIYNNFGKYAGKLDREFFRKVTTEENTNKFWENYNPGDITNMMGGLSFDEMVEATVSYFYDEDKMKGLGEFEPEVLKEVLARKGYEIPVFEYPENMNFSIINKTLHIGKNKLPLDALTGVNSLIIEEENIIVNNVSLDGAKIEAFSNDNFKIEEAKIINTSFFTLTNATSAQFLENNLSFASGHLALKNQSLLKNLSNSSVYFNNQSLESAVFRSDTDENSMDFEDHNFSVWLDRNDTLKIKKADNKVNLSLEGTPEVVDEGFGINVVRLGAGSRYTYEGGKAEPFGIFLPSSESNFTIFFEDKNCSNCATLGFSENIIGLDGVFEYERKKNELFTNIIEGNGSFMLEMDRQMNLFNVTYSGDGIFYYRGVEVDCREYCRYKFSGVIKPALFQEINSEIEFNEMNVYRKLPENKLIMYDQGLFEKLEDWFK